MGGSSSHAIRIANGCNGLHVAVFLWSAIAAFPAPLAQRIKGLALGTAALCATNLIRVISLFYLQPHGGIWFDLAHLYVWETLVVLITLGAFWFWARGAYSAISARMPEADPPGIC